ncbi:hypothetical protein TNCV_1144811 [Trichonephila clavipes]|nr:hypothetical protein TNCV_1144811 [Trichonephila clavipes]
MSSSLGPLKTRHAERPMYVKYVKAQMSFFWRGVEIRRGGATSGVAVVTWLRFKITRAIEDGSRNFEPQSSDEDHTGAGTTSSNSHKTPVAVVT